MFAWQFAKAQHIAHEHNLTAFISMQNHYNLIYREEEREMVPLCADLGVGVTPWSPLARGLLARSPEGVNTPRRQQDPIIDRFYADTAEADKAVIAAATEIAEENDTNIASIALAWLLHRPQVTAPIVGATRSQHLKDAVTALTVTLSADQLKRLESPYIPHALAELGA